MDYSPWGAIQHSEEITPGVRFVSTSRHGGIMITKNFAEKHLTPACRKHGLVYGDYYCYEEDCLWAIPAYELPQYWRKIFSYMKVENPEQYLYRTISAWNAEYLLERGIAPDPVSYQHYVQFMRECYGKIV